LAPLEEIGSGESFIEGFASRYSQQILETLLCDRTTGKSIIWADGEYEALGDGYAPEQEITIDAITGDRLGVVKPRVLKAQESQSRLTKEHAEVFTPSWIVNQMNNALDAVWFRHSGTFNVEERHTWKVNSDRVTFPKVKGHGWHDYVRSTRLEITCGEGPFLCSRYDTVTGEMIPVDRRIGILDRKLRIVDERARSYEDWATWALVALRAIYGYEYQGDNLLIARINVLETLAEHCKSRWGSFPIEEHLHDAAWVISWNLWQMNGLTCAVPTDKLDAPVQSTLYDYTIPEREPLQMSLFGMSDGAPSAEDTQCPPDGSNEPMEGTPLCVIYDWENMQPVEFSSMKGEASRGMKKFYAVIGNPPYQEETEGNRRSTPIYNYFMDEAYKTGDRVELITPARFLFNAGQTPKAWNRKMLNDKHLKVLKYEADGSAIFTGPEIKGGVAITYWDRTEQYKPIGTFIAYDELHGILDKVKGSMHGSIADIFIGAVPYRFTNEVRKEHPDCLEEIGQSFDLRTNILDKLNGKIFFQEKPNDGEEYVSIFGLFNKKREALWIRRTYIDVPQNFAAWKVLLPKASGNGDYGEPLAGTAIAPKYMGHTQSFVSMGNFDI
jgi:type II restriction enzyme